jgi:hypothetical protein
MNQGQISTHSPLDRASYTQDMHIFACEDVDKGIALFTLVQVDLEREERSPCLTRLFHS